VLQPLLNAIDDEWVVFLGRHMLNMGAVEATSRVLIAECAQSADAPEMRAALASRLGYLRKRFPRDAPERHSWAMNVFDVALKHVGFRNAIAHSPVVVTAYADGSTKIQGILNLTPNDSLNVG
jgi:hypothetical protein